MKKSAEDTSYALKPIQRTEMRHSANSRIDNMKRLVNEFSSREMLLDEICQFLKFSESGARKYVRDLRAAGVIELARYINATANYLGKPVYQLTPDKERVSGFLASIVQLKTFATEPKKEHVPSRQEKRLIQMGRNRHFHILGDDAHYQIRINHSPVQRDPLVAALFGSAPAQRGCEY